MTLHLQVSKKSAVYTEIPGAEPETMSVAAMAPAAGDRSVTRFVLLGPKSRRVNVVVQELKCSDEGGDRDASIFVLFDDKTLSGCCNSGR